MCADDVKNHGDIILATARDSRNVPMPVSIVGNYIYIVATSASISLMVKFLKLP